MLDQYFPSCLLGWHLVTAVLTLLLLGFYRFRKSLPSLVVLCDDWLRKSYRTHQIRWSIAIAAIPIILTIGVALLGPSSVVKAFTDACLLSPTNGKATAKIFAVLLGSFAFSITQYVRVRGEADRRDEELGKQERQIRAYAVLPSLDFMFKLKSQTFDTIDKAMGPFYLAQSLTATDNLDEAGVNAEIDRISEALRIALEALSSLANDFGSPRRKPNTMPRYGASIMLAIGKNAIPDLPAVYQLTPDKSDDKGQPGRLRFLNRESNPKNLFGVLVLHEDLLLKRPEDEQSVREKTKIGSPYPALALPVRKPEGEESESPGWQLVLPGAPHAVLNNVAKWVRDTRAWAAEKSSAFDAEVRQQLEGYFCEQGAGQDIQSLLSMRIGTGEDPLGVINFDADIPDFRGDRDVHYEVFSAFIKPSVVLLRPAVSRYLELWWRIIELEANKPSTAQPETKP